MPTYILGISAYYHDSAACLVKDGEIIAAAQEERFTRKKHDAAFPIHAVRYCLDHAGIRLSDLQAVSFYDKPLLKFERLLETYLTTAPAGVRSFVTSMPIWLKEKLMLKRLLRQELEKVDEHLSFNTQNGDKKKKKKLPTILFGEHHESHAASAFYPSPFEKAVVLCIDGVGEWATTSAWLGEGKELKPLWEITFPHSIGLLYSAFTYYTGFKVNSGEYKVMGLAPYGRPVYVDKIMSHLLDLKPDGTFRLDMDYFDYCAGLKMTSDKFNDLFGGPPRKPESELTQKEMDLARSVQEVTEEVMLRLSRSLHEETGVENLCLAGGVALNCVGNGRILREGPYRNIWIQPAAGDAGGAIGVSLTTAHRYFGVERIAHGEKDAMRGSFLGPKFENDEIEQILKEKKAPYTRLSDEALLERVADELAAEKVIGWFQGRMEFGPRALGGRSIIGDPRSEKMQSVMNLKIKYRESFRPFAPSVIRERVNDYFEMDTDSPYMLLVAPVQEKLRHSLTEEQSKLWGIDLLNVSRSEIPAVTHVDYSARVQTVDSTTNPRYYDLLREFEKKTGCGVLINTSFNVRGEPIVGTPLDAYRCFMRTEMDVLVLENCVLVKEEQPEWKEEGDWKEEFELD